MGNKPITNYSHHRPRKIIYINKAVYDENDLNDNALCIIGNGTIWLEYDKYLDTNNTNKVPNNNTLMVPVTPEILASAKTEAKVVKGTNVITEAFIKEKLSEKSSSVIYIVDNDDSESGAWYFYGSSFYTINPSMSKYDLNVDRNHTQLFSFESNSWELIGNIGDDNNVVISRFKEGTVDTNIMVIDEAKLNTWFETTTYNVTEGESTVAKQKYQNADWKIYVAGNFKLNTINASDEEGNGLQLITRENCEDKLGPANDPINNPLAFAAKIALTAGNNKPFYVSTYDASLSSGGEMLQDPLRNLTMTDKVRYIVPLYDYDTDNTETLKIALEMFTALREHVLEMSTEEEQKWRRAYIYTNTPRPASGTSSTDWAKMVSEDVLRISKAYSEERMINVWAPFAKYAVVGDLGGVEEKDLDNMFVAVGVAALRAASNPHQGLSKTNLPWIYSVRNAYNKFVPYELDEIASYGTFVICQDAADSEVYIRHQLTTETELGIMYYEDSVGTNVDDIAYGIKEVVEPYPGRYNIVNNALIEIEKSVADYLTDLTQSGISTEDMRIGPQLIRYENLKVWVDKQLKDRVIISVDLIVPVPMNVVEVHLNAYITTDFDTTTL